MTAELLAWPAILLGIAGNGRCDSKRGGFRASGAACMDKLHARGQLHAPKGTVPKVGDSPQASPHFLTIGHSDHEFAAFSALLRRHQVTALADVRSAPYSRRHPHFNKERLQADLQREEIAYVSLGRSWAHAPRTVAAT